MYVIFIRLYTGILSVSKKSADHAFIGHNNISMYSAMVEILAQNTTFSLSRHGTKY